MSKIKLMSLRMSLTSWMSLRMNLMSTVMCWINLMSLMIKWMCLRISWISNKMKTSSFKRSENIYKEEDRQYSTISDIETSLVTLLNMH